MSDHDRSGVFSFGPFQLHVIERLLKRGDEIVPLGGRALEILIALVEQAGKIVPRHELISRAWPDVIVEEGNVRVQITILRQALGDGQAGARYVVNVPGRGYSFVAPVTHTPARLSSPAIEAPDSGETQGLPARLTRMIGRGDTVSALSVQLMTWRFVSIVGPGGIGKTTVAVSIAHALFSRFSGAVFFIDLAGLNDPQFVATAVASTLGAVVQARNPLVSLLAFIGGKEVLIILDNCEHVIDVAASLAERLVSEAPRTYVLATSREVLRVEGEHVHWLRALDCPPERPAITAAEVLGYPAAQLLMERGAAGGYDSPLTNDEAPVIARLCRHLDGIPLAIELVASRFGTHGIQGTAALLGNRFGTVWQGRRTARPRHQTLTAMVDWSYNLLADYEKVVLRRLSIFAGDFTLEAACFVASETEDATATVTAALASLIAKSLISTSVISGSTNYRLLDTTRSYALGKLDQSGERDQLARRHAEYYSDFFQQTETGLDARPVSEWLADFRHRLDSLRAALDWAFSAQGDASIAVALTEAAVPGWMQLSLVDECESRVQQALAVLQAAGHPDARREMRLYAALGAVLIYTRGGVSDIGELWTKAAQIAERLGDAEYQLRSHYGLYSVHIGHGDPRVALDSAERFRKLAANSTDERHPLIGELMVGASHHYLGNQPTARHHIELMSAYDTRFLEMSHFIRLPINPWGMVQVYLARILWLQGLHEQAMRAAERSVAEARSVSHDNTLCFALAAAACPIALSAGDLIAADSYVELLLEHSATHALTRWNAWGRSYQGVLGIRRGDIDTGLRLLRASLVDEAEDRSSTLRLMAFQMAETLARAGKIDEELAAGPETIVPLEPYGESWRTAELLRVKGELLLMQGTDGAEQHFRQALSVAHRQGALFWELRAAVSLATLLHHQSRPADARTMLEPVYAQFSEGFETADLEAAKALLEALR